MDINFAVHPQDLKCLRRPPNFAVEALFALARGCPKEEAREFCQRSAVVKVQEYLLLKRKIYDAAIEPVYKANKNWIDKAVDYAIEAAWENAR